MSYKDTTKILKENSLYQKIKKRHIRINEYDVKKSYYSCVSD